MEKPEPAWDHWRSFLAVADTGSLSAAARRLELTQPTLGRHIDLLEQALAVPLFLRTAQGLIATDAALALLPEARAMAHAAQALTRAASGAGAAESGTVRLTAAEIIGCEVLPPLLAAFAATHPAIAVELSLSNQTEDILQRETDIALRMFRPVQAAVLTRRIGTVGLGLYAHRRYLDAAGRPDTPDDLSAHALIGPEDAAQMGGLRIGKRPLRAADLRFRCSSDMAQLNLLRAGAGIGICQHRIAARMPDLVPVLPGIALTLDLWLAMHEGQRANRPIRRLWDHLAATLPEAL